MFRRDRGSGVSEACQGRGGREVCSHNEGTIEHSEGEYTSSSRNFAKESKLCVKTDQSNCLPFISYATDEKNALCPIAHANS